MLQTEGITALEERIVGSGCLQIAHLCIVGYRLRELTGVEMAVTQPIEGVRIRRFGSQRIIDILREGITRLVILRLRETGITLQIARY